MIETNDRLLKIEHLEPFFNDYHMALSKSLSTYKDQLENFHQNCQGFIKKQLSEYMENLEELHKGWIPIKETFIKDNRLQAFDYNIFHIIGRSKSYPKGYCELEVVTHSPFLADLLDPTGAHGQGELFYRSFIMTVVHMEENKRKLFLSVDCHNYTVARECASIDIFIYSYKNNNRFAVIIENKINAADQPDQLKRYYDYAKYNFNDEQIMLIYLTKHGNPPSLGSMDLTTQKRLRNMGVLFELSYKKDIRNWLTKCRDKHLPTNIDVILQQYIAVIDCLN